MIRKTAIARAVALALGAVVIGASVAPSAYAQSNTTGSIYGTVGQPAGTEVLVENSDTGLKRSIKPDASGRYNLVSLPTGIYNITLSRNGALVEKRTGVEVLLSQGVEVSFGGATVVVITGSAIRRLDLSSAGSTTVFTSKDLERVPVAPNVGAIIQLAPNTTRGDSRYGGGGAPSFGGASASENAYYINGFPVTTLLTQVGFSQLPFNSIAQAQVLTGGYGAEFGRSTGGVVNMITKRGGNDFEAGGAITFEPDSLKASERDQVYAANGSTLANRMYVYNRLNKQDRTVLSAYGSGALIKDKLFFFGAFERTKTERDTIRLANTSANPVNLPAGFQERDVTIPRYLIKLDYAITDNHVLEYTKIGDTYKDDRKYYGFNYATLTRNDTQAGGVSYENWGPTPVAAQQGADVDILKYTGFLTQDLTLTAVYGKTRTEHTQSPVGYNPAIPQVTFTGDARAPGIKYVEGVQTATGNLLVPGAYDKNEGLRIDLEFKLNSSHTLRGGIDYNKIKSLSGSARAGGSVWDYARTDPAVPLTASAALNTVNQPLAQAGYYANQVIISSGSTPEVDQNAAYIEDKWQVNKDLLLVLGLRNEGFNNKNGDGNSYIKLTKQIAPRFSATWDPAGDQQMKVFGTLGRYHVPLPTNVAIRAAGSSLFTTENFAYTGVDPATGVPTGLTSLGKPYSNNNEYGQAKDPREVAAQDMKGNYQDELTLGIERAVARGLTAGVKFTYRTLKTALDDHCDDRPFYAWADRNNIDASNWGYNCALFNPGLANRFTIDLDGDGKLENIALSAADLGVIKPKRTYAALDLFIEKQFDGKWAGKVTYTYSKNKGNAEGQLKSDIGQGDVATTQDYDFPEFSVNADGLLPNNRTHKIKAYGFYQVMSQVGVGGAMVWSSGRPKNCIGNAPSSPGLDTPFTPGVSPVTNYSGYGSAYFFCSGQPSPRGTAGTQPPEFTVDANLVYTPDFLKGLKLRLDVLNLLNRQVTEVTEERFNNAGGATSIRPLYNTPLSISAPRSAKLTVSYDHKF
ncbi:MAG: TonB-dependent receptor [Betaproteobacteria bacterium]|nr:TonB-dependent receptor [Betaproteobacteria bacterium]